MMMMGLRLADGVRIDLIEALCGPQEGWLDRAAMTQAVADGWLNLQKDSQTGSDTQLCLTAAGRLRLNHILAMILR
jgi:coproporphyrinogen III oxidase-like Fe-S oxidoreductase